MQLLKIFGVKSRQNTSSNILPQNPHCRRMYHFISITLILFTAISTSTNTELSSSVDDSGCPLWTYRHEVDSKCRCGTTLNGKVKCNMNTSTLTMLHSLCMTYDLDRNETFVGYCPYSAITNSGLRTYQLQMQQKDNITNMSCSAWKRKGTLCSQCRQGYGVPLYSYHLECVECKDFRVTELFKFLAVSFLPLTVMCILVTLFHLNTLRPPWSVFVLMAQILSAPHVIQVQILRTAKKRDTTIEAVSTTLYGPWNLDFFRALYNSICISPHITSLQSAAIEGSIGLYPLVLLCVLYSVVKLHDRGSRVFVALWKPFHILLSRFRQKLNLKSSLIDTFATFILLSYIKIGITAFYILTPTQLWSPDGSYEWVVYYDPSIVYFGPSHIAYAIITLILSFMILVVPVILLFLYPYRWFQRCLNRFHLRSLALNAFVDAFQGCYKDGTDGTRDCRYFAAFQLLLRILLSFFFVVVKNIVTSIFLSSVVLGIYITLFVIAKPYRVAIYNATDIPVLMSLLLIGVSVNISIFTHHYYSISFTLSQIFMTFSYIVPLLYMTCWAFVYIKHFINQHCRQRTCEITSLLS